MLKQINEMELFKTALSTVSNVLSNSTDQLDHSNMSGDQNEDESQSLLLNKKSPQMETNRSTFRS